MRMWMLCLGVLLAVAGGCVLTPSQDSEVCGSDARVVLSGAAPGARDPIVVQSYLADDGSYLQVASTSAGRAPLRISGEAVYLWSTGVTIPADRWSATTDGLLAQLRVRLEDSNLNLLTFDDPSCVSDRLIDGDLPSVAAALCASGSSLLTLRAPRVSACNCNPTHDGDLVIDDEATMEALACVTTVNGNLGVSPNNAFRTVSLPNLQSVNGDVTIDYTFAGAPPPEDSRIIDFPALTTITGDLTMSGTVNSVLQNRLNVALDALTRVDGTIRLQARSTNLIVRGLPALASHAGAFVMTANGDRDLAAFAPALTTAGSLDLELAGTSYHLFDGVVSVSGNVRVHGTGVVSSAFAGLQSVGGDLTMQNASLPSWTAGSSGPLGALTTVTGDLRFEQGVLMDVQPTAGAVITVGGDIAFVHNSRLTRMDAAFLQATGSVIVQDNCALDLDDPSTFVSPPTGAPSTVSNAGCP